MKEELEAAAQWWADAISGVPKMDNGDFMQSALVTLAAIGQPVTPEQVATFKAELIKRLETDERFVESWREALERDRPAWGGAARTLDVDYGPCVELADAAEAAGLGRRCLRFPIKTCMRIDPGLVQVGHGYRAPFVAIYGEIK
jgi:hypothetical protein